MNRAVLSTQGCLHGLSPVSWEVCGACGPPVVTTSTPGVEKVTVDTHWLVRGGTLQLLEPAVPVLHGHGVPPTLGPSRDVCAEPGRSLLGLPGGVHSESGFPSPPGLQWGAPSRGLWGSLMPPGAVRHGRGTEVARPWRSRMALQ